jgi:hypothetical protein
LLKELERNNDPHDVLEIAPGVVLAARADPEFPTLAPGAISRAAEPQIHMGSNDSAGASAPLLDTTFRAADVSGDRSSIGKWTKAFIGVLLAVGSAGAAAAWQHYGDTAKAMVANLTPWTVATSSPPAANPAPSEQPATPDVQAPVATAAPPQPAPPAQPAEGAAASAPSSGQAQSLASMAQQIEQLKASVEQLKAGQEQLSRDIAKASEAKAPEANLRPRIGAPKLGALQPRPGTAPTHKPKPAFSAAPYAPPPLSPPAAAPPPAPQPAPPPQATVESDGNPVVRPPLPLR